MHCTGELHGNVCLPGQWQQWKNASATNMRAGRGWRSLEGSSAPEGTGNPPGVGLLVAVVERLQALLLLLLAQLGGVRDLEESWGKLHQPARVDGRHLPHVLLGGQHQFVIHHPVKRDSRSRNQFIQTRSNKTRAGVAKLAPF